MDMLNREVTYVYEIKYSKESTNKKNRCLVKSRIKPKDICDLILYIQYKYKSIIPQSDLTEYEVKSMEGIIVKMMELENEINVDIDVLVDLKKEIMSIIKKTNNLNRSRQAYVIFFISHA